jgi:phi13 family phage major tail protein
MPNSGEYKSRIGLDSLYVAVISQDDAAGYAAGTPAYLAPAAEASQEPSSSFEVQYADDQPYDVMTAEGDTKIALVVTNIDLQTLATITGRVFDAASGRLWDNGGTAPYCALSFRSLKSNGGYRYYQYLKGKFDMPKEETATKGESPEPKTLELTFTAIRTTYKWNLGSVTDSVKRIVGDDDTTNFSETGWFTSVQTPSWSAPAALSLSSSVPTDGATGISVSANPTLTFNNTMLDSVIYAVGLFLVSDGSVIAGAITLDSTKKIITINPTSSLSASTAYLITYAVTDIYGQHLTGAVNFTTA